MTDLDIINLINTIPERKILEGSNKKIDCETDLGSDMGARNDIVFECKSKDFRAFGRNSLLSLYLELKPEFYHASKFDRSLTQVFLNIHNFYTGNLVYEYIMILQLLFAYDKSICKFHQPYRWYIRLNEIDVMRHQKHLELIEKITLSLEKLCKELNLQIKIEEKKVYFLANVLIFYQLSNAYVIIDNIKHNEKIKITYPVSQEVYVEELKNVDSWHYRVDRLILIKFNPIYYSYDDIKYEIVIE